MNGEERLKTFKSIITERSTLKDKNVDSGYSVSDMNFLIENLAHEKNVVFFNWTDVFENPQQQPILNESSIVSSVVYFYDNSLDWFQMLDYWAKDKITKESRFVVPVIMYPKKTSGKESHYLVICFDFKPENNTVDIVLLEQHAMLDKTDKNYDEKLDYSELIDYYLSALKAYCEKLLGYTNVRVIKNEKPISRRKRVCGVVVSEIIRRLLSVENSSSLINFPVVLSDDDIDKIHKKNKNIAQTVVLKQASKDITQRLNTAKIQSQSNQMDY